MVPPTATGKPIAAEVPIACLRDTLHQSKKGTTTVPPPMDTRLLNQPVSMPASVMPVVPGNWREACGRTSNKICAAAKYTNSAKNIPDRCRSEEHTSELQL